MAEGSGAPAEILFRGRSPLIPARRCCSCSPPGLGPACCGGDGKRTGKGGWGKGGGCHDKPPTPQPRPAGSGRVQDPVLPHLLECRTMARPTALIQSSLSCGDPRLELSSSSGPACGRGHTSNNPTGCRPSPLPILPCTLSVSAMKYMLVSAVEISKAWGLLMVSSAPLIDRQWFTCGKDGKRRPRLRPGEGSAALRRQGPCRLSCLAEGRPAFGAQMYVCFTIYDHNTSPPPGCHVAVSPAKRRRHRVQIWRWAIAEYESSTGFILQGRLARLTGRTTSDLNQKILPCLRTNHLDRKSADQVT